MLDKLKVLSSKIASMFLSLSSAAALIIGIVIGYVASPLISLALSAVKLLLKLI